MFLFHQTDLIIQGDAPECPLEQAITQPGLLQCARSGILLKLNEMAVEQPFPTTIRNWLRLVLSTTKYSLQFKNVEKDPVILSIMMRAVTADSS
jgi:hypothetical protein